MESKEYAKELLGIVNRLATTSSSKERFERLVNVWLLSDGKDKKELGEDLDSIANLLIPRLIFSKKYMAEVPSTDDSQGDIKIGKVMHGDKLLYDFGVSQSEFNQGHILVTSRAGHGKTTVLMLLIRELIQKEIPFLVICFKQDFRHLLRHYPNLIILSWKDLKVNLLKPPLGVSIDEWKQQFLNIFGHTEGVWSGSTQYLLQFLDKVYEKKGENASVLDVFELLNNSNPGFRKMQEYWSVIQTRIYGLVSKLKSVVACDDGLDLEKLLSYPVVLELDGLSYEDQNLLALFFFFWIYAYRKAQRHRGTARHVLIIDEAKRIFSASDQYSATTREFSHISPADQFVDEIRDYSELLVIADNEISKLSSSVIAQSYLKIVGNVSGRDVEVVAEAMNLKEEEVDALFQLERGEWLVKLAARYTKPFIIKTEDFPIEKNVTDEEIRSRMEPILRTLIKEPKRLPSQFLELSPESESLIFNVIAHPLTNLSKQYQLVGLAGEKATRAKNELLERNLVTETTMPRKQHRLHYLIPTEQGLDYLENAGYDVRLWRKRGNASIEHRFFQFMILIAMKNVGYQVSMEKMLDSGTIVDVLASNDSMAYALEVELDSDINASNKLRILNEARALIVLATQQTVLDKARKILSGNERISFYLVGQFLDGLNDHIIPEISRNGSN